jgi:hypothetical protein
MTTPTPLSLRERAEHLVGVATRLNLDHAETFAHHVETVEKALDEVRRETEQKMLESGTFCGYTHKQIIEMDRWMQTNAMSWQIFEEWFRKGVKAGSEQVIQIAQETAERLRSLAKAPEEREEHK